MAYFKTPIVVVLGATGAGKSKLALQLAQKFNGEIISADVMQMYKGLDIVTNKVTKDELSSVKHHMIDFLDPLGSIRVNEFRNKCLPLIEELLRKNVIPFICGGTNYYIESLLWKVLVDDDEVGQAGAKKMKPQDVQLSGGKPEILRALDGDSDDESVDTAELYEYLREADPERASTLLPVDRRKIFRSLQIHRRHGRPHSEILREQRESEGGSALGGPLRFRNVCVIWVDSEKGVLDERCDKRVEKMIERGMLKELEGFHEDYNINRTTPGDYTVGIFQAIGFKEFHDYLLLSEEEKSGPLGKKLYTEGCERLKYATHQYARRQTRWIRQRLLNPAVKFRPPVYSVDSTDPSKWDEVVLEPSVDLVKAFVEESVPKMTPTPVMERSKHSYEDLRKIFHCDICDRLFKGIEQYEVHLGSKKHKHQLKKSRDFYTVVITFNGSNDLSKLKIVKTIKSVKEELSTGDISSRMAEGGDFDLGVRLDQSGANDVISKLRLSGLNVRLELLDKKPK